MRTHGITGTYRAGCRCDACRAANAAYHKRLRRERVVDDWAKHGRVSTYKNYMMCRCDDCKAAVRAEGKVRRAS